MRKFNLGLKVGGHIEFILEIAAKTLKEAKDSWAWLSGHWDPMWDIKSQTYGGWPVVETKIPALQRKADKLTSWQY